MVCNWLRLGCGLRVPRSSPFPRRVKKLQEEVQESVNVFLQKLHVDPRAHAGPIDAGAEEELFRNIGRQAAAEALARRWEHADSEELGRCPKCGMGFQDLGLRTKGFQTLCGPMRLKRCVGYCGHCHETRAVLDERLGSDETGMTPGIRWVICRVALQIGTAQERRAWKFLCGSKTARPAPSNKRSCLQPGTIAAVF
jgi:hypothetical protein